MYLPFGKGVDEVTLWLSLRYHFQLRLKKGAVLVGQITLWQHVLKDFKSVYYVKGQQNVYATKFKQNTITPARPFEIEQK